ncbi:DPP IV N-terminal domain-containing protein, partial [Gemmatimonadota bacterium]
MRTSAFTGPALLILGVLGGVPKEAAAQEVTVDHYARAELLLPWHASLRVSGDEVDPNWMEGGSRFWYRNKTGTGHEFIFVDPERNLRRPLFDHYRLSAAMSLANDTSYVGQKLPFDDFEFVDGAERQIEFQADMRRFQCDIQAYACTVSDTLPTDVPFVESPDGLWEAFVEEHDLYVRGTGGGDTIRLTNDGEEFYAYGLRAPRPNELRSGAPRRPSVSWAPDSRKLVVSRQDERGVEHMHYISYTPQRPVHYSQPYALPGDSIVPLPTVHVLHLPADLEGAAADPDQDRAHAAQNLRIEIEPRPNTLSLGGSAVDSTWAPDSEAFFVTWLTRASKSAYLGRVDESTGDVTVLARDTSKTFVETSQRDPVSWYVSDSGDDAFWWSERDGWAHIWRFDARGNLKNQVTSGPWAVGAIQNVDEGDRYVYFTAYGREDDRIPYYGPLYRVGFDGSDLLLLTPEEGKHRIEFSPDGRFFVDTYSDIETPPVTVLRAAPDGRIVRTLEEADASGLEAVGWSPSQVFRVKARDGVTDIWGVIDFPPAFDPTGSYPVLDHIYPGPQVGSVGDWSFKAGGRDAALAQLGFV